MSTEFRPHNTAFMIVGTLLLWVCWLFFNAGSVEEVEEDLNRKIGRIMMCNIIGPACSGLFAVLFKTRITGEYNRLNKYDIGTFCNGIIVGLVAVTASCDDIKPYFAPFISLIAAVMYSFGVKLMRHLHIDDPVEATPLHMSGAIVGTLAVALFDKNVGLITGHSAGWK